MKYIKGKVNEELGRKIKDNFGENRKLFWNEVKKCRNECM